MENIHILEPIFHIYAPPIHSGGRDWTAGPLIGGFTPRAKTRAGTGGFFFSLLDRLTFFSTPRIISAECLAENAATAGSPVDEKRF
ncbi:MAG: hypothetical protein LBD42_06235 [Desulfovibrio sp.]|jgi:hypothetical protein|nr:hypothetical protein [Desulfovibrio sp.]